jgi:wyosine [tRNA(Phe)-imidazoG37] synthetase (radical SAM superfamily)
MSREPFHPEDVVKSCPKLESGLNLALNGLRACTRGALMPPLFCSSEELSAKKVTKELIVERRKQYIRMLNDEKSVMDCKDCLMIEYKRYGDISFNRLGHIDLQHYSICNLRCSYCAYTRDDMHFPPQYDALDVLKLFSPEEVEWNAHVDFAGGEPTCLDNLPEYLDFFRTRRIRVLMFTNAVLFNQAIYDGLKDGSLFSVITSLDAGTPSTYNALRRRDVYLQVLENLSRYAAAGSKGNGTLVVKYIFSDVNLGDDDIAGFAYAMLALRPQKVWLTFDFSPMFLRQQDHDYSRQIEAYAKLYWLLKKHGIESFHYYKEAIATVSREGRDICNRVLAAIEKRSPRSPLDTSDLKFSDFRRGLPLGTVEPDKFSLNPLTLCRKNARPAKWDLEGKRVLMVPACSVTEVLLSNMEIQKADWIGIIDRSPIQQGKRLHGRMIYSYEAIPSLGAEIVLVTPPEKHRDDILSQIMRHAPSGVQIAELQQPVQV